VAWDSPSSQVRRVRPRTQAKTEKWLRLDGDFTPVESSPQIAWRRMERVEVAHIGITHKVRLGTFLVTVVSAWNPKNGCVAEETRSDKVEAPTSEQCRRPVCGK